MLTLITPYQEKDWKIWKYSMSTSGEMSIEKNRKKVNQNKRVSSQQIFEKEGATVAASHLPFPAGCLVRAGRAASPRKQLYRKVP
jgi:hypothetical protein